MLARSLAPLTPALIGTDHMPDVDTERTASAAAELVCRGPLEVMLTVLGSVFVLNLMAVLTCGRRLRTLPSWQQMDLFTKAFNSRFTLLRGASVLAGLPLKVAYYNQDDVCRALGFERGLLIKDALDHQVSRGR